jgi:hypothetical protein
MTAPPGPRVLRAGPRRSCLAARVTTGTRIAAGDAGVPGGDRGAAGGRRGYGVVLVGSQYNMTCPVKVPGCVYWV